MSSAQQTSVPALPAANTFLATDRVVAVSNASGNAVVVLVGVNQLLSNTANLQISVTQLVVNSALGTPANSGSVVARAGTWWTDGNYVYVATSNNVCKRLGPLQAF